jgi:uncharacterized membrane protein
MFLATLALSLPSWKPHFTFLTDHLANEMMVLRWIHLTFGIIWIGLLYFFNLVLTPTMKNVDAAARIKIYPELMSHAMAWFRWSSLANVAVGIRYYAIHLSSDAHNAGQPALTVHWLVVWFLVWLGAYALIYALQLPATGIRNNVWVRAICIAVVVVAASWIVLVLNAGESSSSAHLAISIGGGLGLVMFLNTWGVVWRVQKRLIAWTRAAAEQGTPMPPEAQRLMRWNFLTARTSFWLSFPMLFFMAAASHYPFLTSIR